MNKLAVFDLDGTLIDSVPDIADSLNITLEKFGHLKRNEKEVAQIIGNGARNLIIRAIDQKLSEQEIDQRLKFYNKIYTDCGNPKTKLFDGVKEVLLTLKSKGFMIGLLTNKPQSATEKVYETYLKDIGFNVVVGQTEGGKIKPDPTALLDMLKTLDVKKENAFMVGDGETDVQVAINAGVNAVSVLYGYRNKSQLEKVGAKVFVETPLDLLKVIF